MTRKISKAKRRKLVAVIRPLDPSDRRSLEHPSHDEQWLELARAIGRSMADEEFDSQDAKKKKRA
jgi:hypothetical protein